MVLMAMPMRLSALPKSDGRTHGESLPSREWPLGTACLHTAYQRAPIQVVIDHEAGSCGRRGPSESTRSR